MSNPVIRRYFSNESLLNTVAEDFKYLIRLVNDSYGEYVFQLRENYFNIYYRGNSLARIGLSTEGTYSVRIHRKFLCGSVLQKMDQYCVCQSHAGGTKVDPVIRFRVKACQLRRFF